ncbi:hypothetical protein HY230_09530 [Candidatus Acetothermia bacterium]|nr:hypothetical protein [Candidatus Acetothermia bacterium]
MFKGKFAGILLAVLVAGLGFNVLAADCGKIADQKDLNALVLKFADMPDPDAAKNAVCGGIVSYTTIARSRTLNPITLTDVPSLDLVNRMYDGLLGGTADQPTATGLSEAFEVTKVGDKGQKVTFTIRKGVKFANGDPVTAEDVRFTVENLIFPKDIATSARDGYACGDGKLPTVKVEAANKISFTCNVTLRVFVATMDPGYVLNKKKVLELVPNVERTPKDFNTALGLTTPPDKLKGIGTGRYVLTKIDPASVAEFARNPLFWEADEKGQQLPYLNGIRILVAPTQGQEIALAQFRNGQTDFLAPRPEDIAVLQSDKAGKGLQVNDDIDSGRPGGGTTQFWVFSWTTKNPALRAVFRSKEFRQAMSMITDRETMRKNLLLGLGIQQFSHVPVPSQFYVERDPKAQGAVPQDAALRDQWEKTGKYLYNPQAAAALLDKIGLTIPAGSSDGIRIIPANFQGQGNPAGKLEFTLNTNVGNTIREEEIKLIAAEAKKIGVNAKAEPKDFAALVDQLVVGDYEAIRIGLAGGNDPESGLNVYTCEGNLHFYNVDCPKTPTQFEKDLDALYAKGVATLDRNEAGKIWDQVQILVGQNQPLVHTVLSNALFAYRMDVLKDHGRAVLGNDDVVYCNNGKCRGG